MAQIVFSLSRYVKPSEQKHELQQVINSFSLSLRKFRVLMLTCALSPGQTNHKYFLSL